ATMGARRDGVYHRIDSARLSEIADEAAGVWCRSAAAAAGRKDILQNVAECTGERTGDRLANRDAGKIGKDGIGEIAELHLTGGHDLHQRVLDRLEAGIDAVSCSGAGVGRLIGVALQRADHAVSRLPARLELLELGFLPGVLDRAGREKAGRLELVQPADL